eukprot:SAG31_NODE_1545_length_7942_cov_6.001020_7_plen_69_part_00
MRQQVRIYYINVQSVVDCCIPYRDRQLQVALAMALFRRLFAAGSLDELSACCLATYRQVCRMFAASQK